MNSKTLSIDSPDFLESSDKPSWLDRLARRIVRSKLRNLECGELTIFENGQIETFGDLGDATAIAATIHVHSPAFYSDVAFGGSIGAGEAYIRGAWTTPDPVARATPFG